MRTRKKMEMKVIPLMKYRIESDIPILSWSSMDISCVLGGGVRRDAAHHEPAEVQEWSAEFGQYECHAIIQEEWFLSGNAVLSAPDAGQLNPCAGLRKRTRML